MKILGSISSGYKKIATGIAIVAFLALMYVALIPGGSLASVYNANGIGIGGALVKIVEWPQYNATTAPDGTYTINSVPVGTYNITAKASGYATNLTKITVTEGSNLIDFTLVTAKLFYIPFLYHTTANVYDAALQVHNNGTSNATVELTFYYLNGTAAGNGVFIVKPGELLNKDVYDITGIQPALFVGSAIISSDVPVKAGGFIKTQSKNVYSLATSFTEAESTTNTNIPFLYNGGNYDSGLQVVNPGTAPANVTVKFYYLNGTQAATTTYTLPPKNLVGTTVASLLPGVFFVGSSIVTSDQPIIAQGYIRTTASGIYSIAPALGAPVTDPYIPFLYNGGNYDSGLQVFNPGTAPANVTVKFYYLNGTQAATTTYTLPPKNLVGTTVASLLPGVFFVGPATVTSDQPIVAQGYIRTTASNVYSIAPQVRKPASAINEHVPFLYNLPGSHDSGIQVVNPNGVVANINVKYYYSNSTLAGTYSGAVPSNGLVGVTVNSVVSGSFTGYSIISADQPVVSQGYIRQSTDNIYSIAPPVER